MRSKPKQTISPHYEVSPFVRFHVHERGLILFHTQTGKILQSNRAGIPIWNALRAGKSLVEISSDFIRGHSLSEVSSPPDTNAFLATLERAKLVRPAASKQSISRSVETVLIAEALLELLVYDLRVAILGFHGVYRTAQPWVWKKPRSVGVVHDAVHLLHAVDRACCLYLKPVRCLQRSIIAARMLRRRGLRPMIQIGYRTDPFFGHAWVELDGETLGDSRAFRRKLHVLDTI
ncbi:MAG TPA: lasso peptide biosynthesis B2 protein [Bryobacteraceae bacterium]|nr:lasso peptide biosynthesis B2 protein [Bryobacteraceae bacterium]